MNAHRIIQCLAAVIALHGPLMAQGVSADSTKRATQAYLEVNSLPQGAGVFIKGAYAGATPLLVVRAPADSLTVVVSKQFCEPWITTVTLKAGDTLRISAVPRRLEARVTILDSDPAASVYVDGLLAGTGSVSKFPVLPGDHDLLVRDSVTGRSARRHIMVGEAQEQGYVAELGYRSLWRVAGSVLIPGFAQFSDGAYVKAGGLFALSAVAVALGAGAGGTYSDKLGQYNAAVASYGAATNEQDAVARREIMLQKHDDLNSAYRVRSLSYAAVGVVYALNLLDTILNHMVTDRLRFLPESSDMKFVAYGQAPSIVLRAELILQ
jgi:hypothetical protein